MTPATNPATSPAWKDEVNRRIAEHRCRKPAVSADRVSAIDVASNMSRRAQEAAARVAARYANAPSFGDALVTEAREAIRVAEEASRTATQARKVAEGVLANLHAISSAENTPPPAQILLPELVERPCRNVEPVSIRLATFEQQQIAPPEAPTQPSSPQPVAANNLFEDEWWKLPESEPAVVPEPIAAVARYATPEPLPIAITEAPREFVSTRRVRPRIAAGPLAATSTNMQLSIFEVSPLLISTEPEAATVWEQPDWLRIDTEAHVQEHVAVLSEHAPKPTPAHILQPAFLGRRLMALTVDGVLIAAALLGAMGAALVRDAELPGLHTIAITSAAALAIIVLLYLTLFFTLARATPGMQYARLRFTGFDGATPTRAQRAKRLLALLLAVLPIGLGFLWSLFDEDKLCWHDRFSGTYLAHR